MSSVLQRPSELTPKTSGLSVNSTSLLGGLFAAYWLVGLHLFMHNGGGSGLYLPSNSWGWIFGSLVLGLGLWSSAQQQELRFSSLQGGLWLGAVLMFLPMFYPGAEWKAHAVPRLLGLGGGLLFLLCLHQWQLNRQQRDKLLYLLLGGVAIEALLGLVQFYLLTPGNWIGYNTQANRPYGMFQQPNVMASFVATGLALAIWLELRQHPNAWLKTLRYGVILASSLLLVLLQSRVGQLGGLLVVLLLAPQLKGQGRLMRILGLVGMGVLIGLIPQLGLVPELGTSGVKRGVEMYQSAGVRWPIWTYSAKLIAQAPWTGWGYGNFEATLLNHYMADKALTPAMPALTPNLDHPHNELLYWGVEGGLLSMLGLLLMGGSVLWRASHTGWKQASALLALIAPILLHTQTEYPLYHAVALWWALLLLIHVLDAEVHEQQASRSTWRSYTHRSQMLMRTFAVLIPLMVLPFMLTTLHTAWLVTKVQRGGADALHHLDEIINPLPWSGRLELMLRPVQLSNAMVINDQETIQSFVDWGQAYVRHTPRYVIYANLAAALQALGRHEESKATREKIKILYPGSPAAAP